MSNGSDSDIPVDFQTQNAGKTGKGLRKSTRTKKTKQYGKVFLGNMEVLYIVNIAYSKMITQQHRRQSKKGGRRNRQKRQLSTLLVNLEFHQKVRSKSQ